jgi:superfamily I DNA and/or RNA helicase
MPIFEHCLHVKIGNLVYAEDMTDAEKMKKKNEEEKRLIEEADVILTTCASSACEDLKCIKSFYAVIIDEACQVVEIK